MSKPATLVRKPVWTTGDAIVIPGALPASAGPAGKAGATGDAGEPQGLVEMVLGASDFELELAAEIMLSRLLSGG